MLKDLTFLDLPTVISIRISISISNNIGTRIIRIYKDQSVTTAGVIGSRLIAELKGPPKVSFVQFRLLMCI
jgi:hypothetical protein